MLTSSLSSLFFPILPEIILSQMDFMENIMAPTVEMNNPKTMLRVNLFPAKINLDKMHVNRSLVLANN